MFDINHSLRRLIAASVILTATATSSIADNVSCNDLKIQDDELPLNIAAEIEVPAHATISVPALNDPIVDIRIRPATMLNADEAYLCGDDYGASIDADGNAKFWFGRIGPYYAQLTRQSGLVQAANIGVGVTFRNAGGPGTRPAWQQFNTPPHDVALHDPGHSDRMLEPWDEPKPANGLNDAASKICNAATDAGGKVDVVIDAHGNSGGMSLGGDRLDSSTACDFGSSLAGKVKCLTLFSCNVGDNLDILCKVAQKSGAKVTAYTGKVTNAGDDVFVEDGEGIVTKEVPSKPQPKEVKPSFEGAPGEPGGPLGPAAPQPVILPLDAFHSSFFDAVLQLLAVWNAPDSAWDLNGDGIVDALDLDTLLDLAP